MKSDMGPQRMHASKEFAWAVCRRGMTGHAPEYRTMATPVPSATPMARPSVQLPSSHAASDSITPLGPAALAARQLNKADDQMERWSRALQQLRCPNDETVVRLALLSLTRLFCCTQHRSLRRVMIKTTTLCSRLTRMWPAVCGGHENGVIRSDGRHKVPT